MPELAEDFGTGWLDVSVALRSGMPHWPGDPDVEVEPLMFIAAGDGCNVTRMAMCCHVGTHMDAPRHYLEEGAGIDQMPLEATVGPARILQLSCETAITRADLEPHNIAPGERILLRTSNSNRLRYDQPFTENFIYIAADGARYLAERQIRCVGVDYLSVGGCPTDSEPTHVALLAAGIWIIEGLDLSGVSAGPVDLLCLPLKIAGADGAPARVFVRPRRL